MTTQSPVALSQQYEIFCLHYVASSNATQAAITAGYSAHTARQQGYRMLQRADIRSRIRELNEPAALAASAVMTDKIAGPLERKERLSEILRARVSDFVKTDAKGRAWLSTNLDGCQSAAIASIKTRLEIIPGFDDAEDKQAWITELKLHDPVKSIHELNDMEMVGKKDAPDPASVNVAMVNNNFNVVSTRGAELIQHALDGRVPDGPGHGDD